jgi:probable biosynthetic protein (TIGR04098 family)
MTVSISFTAGMPQLDLVTLREDWALATAAECHWSLLAQSLGLPPSRWFDTQGDRMYAGVVHLASTFDLKNPVREDDRVTALTRLTAIRKPHALSTTVFEVAGTVRAELRLLTSFVKRSETGSNKKLVRVRDLWMTADHGGDEIDLLLQRHHQQKALPDLGAVLMHHEANRMTDFNAADLFYFSNFVRLAKAAEWRLLRQSASGGATHTARREAWFYGNANDGDQLQSRAALQGAALQTSHHAPDGRRIFLSQAEVQPFTITPR